MNNLAIAQNKEGVELSLFDKVALQGDLSKLDDTARANYILDICNSIGLNPKTRPFEYIVLNGKLQLYARKDCTEQLRKINLVSVTKLEGEMIGDHYRVTAEGIDKYGRTDIATAVVYIGNLKGDALANAMMKAETKAKRRLTLSICGLGFLDESEIETCAPMTASKINPRVETLKSKMLQPNLIEAEQSRVSLSEIQNLISNATNIDELKTIAGAVSGLSEEEKITARKLYSDKQKELNESFINKED